MKKTTAIIITVLSTATALAAQSTTDFAALYNKIVDRMGYAGPGVESVLDKWEQSDSTDINMMAARFSYWFAKSRKDTIEVHDVKKYLGNKPVITLKDSTGRPVNYFQVQNYDDIAFGNGIKWLDKAIRRDNCRLDVKMIKVDALIAYEKGSPDMTRELLGSIITEYYTKHPKWDYPGETVNDEFVRQLIQNYCYILYNQGTPESFEAFKSLSEQMLKYEKKDINFLNNLGAYYQTVKNDDKKALKYYNKSLKIEPGNEAATKNIELIRRKSAKK